MKVLEMEGYRKLLEIFQDDDINQVIDSNRKLFLKSPIPLRNSDEPRILWRLVLRAARTPTGGYELWNKIDQISIKKKFDPRPFLPFNASINDRCWLFFKTEENAEDFLTLIRLALTNPYQVKNLP